MIRHRVSVLNRTSLDDLEVDEVTAALRTQVQRDFAPAWGISSSVHYVARGDKDTWKGTWNLVILDSLSEAGALGYHDLTPEGAPVGFVGLEESKADGVSWSSVASHELLEMLGDPYINLTAANENDWLYAYEAADAVEGDGYHVGKVEVSSFVYPTWFAPGHDQGPYDYLEVVSAPFELAPGGYAPVRPPGGDWTQIWGDRAAKEPRLTAVEPHDHTRRARRFKPRVLWQRSEP